MPMGIVSVWRVMSTVIPLLLRLMDESNVFNSFSFKQWARSVRQQKIEEEILRQRMEQVIRLRSKLIRERALRDQMDLLTEEDVDKLVHYMSTGPSFAGVAHGIQSAFRLGITKPPLGAKRPNADAAAVPSAGVLPKAMHLGAAAIGRGGAPGQYGVQPIRAGKREQRRPTALSEHLPPEERRDDRYLFAELPLVAPLHPASRNGRQGTSGTEAPTGGKAEFRHNVRHAERSDDVKGASERGTERAPGKGTTGVLFRHNNTPPRRG